MKKLFTAILLIFLLFFPVFGQCSTHILDEAIQLASDQTIMDAALTREWNKQNDDIYIYGYLENNALIAKIRNISIIPSAKRYIKNSDGSFTEADSSYYNRLTDNINYTEIADNEDIKYGFIIRRTPLKTFPCNDEAFTSISSVYDRFLESTLYPFEPVVVLHESRDNRWFFIKMYNYEGWVSRDDVAITSIEILKLYDENSNFVVVSVPKTYTLYTTTELDMGCLFPLVKEHEDYYTVLCPKKSHDDRLYFSFGYIRKEDASIGYLQYTQKNVLKQASKFLDEPYGWGGMNGYRDCSALMMDIYRSMGIKLKRNTDQQELMNPYNISVKNMNKKDKENILKEQPAGSLLFIDGHVMLYLGLIENRPYILHDVTGYYSDGAYVNANKVTVTDVYIKNSQGYAR